MDTKTKIRNILLLLFGVILGALPHIILLFPFSRLIILKMVSGKDTAGGLGYLGIGMVMFGIELLLGALIGFLIVSLLLNGKRKFAILVLAFTALSFYLAISVEAYFYSGTLFKILPFSLTAVKKVPITTFELNIFENNTGVKVALPTYIPPGYKPDANSRHFENSCMILEYKNSTNGPTWFQIVQFKKDNGLCGNKNDVSEIGESVYSYAKSHANEKENEYNIEIKKIESIGGLKVNKEIWFESESYIFSIQPSCWRNEPCDIQDDLIKVAESLK